MPKAWITYQKVGDESVQEGDFSEHGFYSPGGWECPLEVTGDAAAAVKADNAVTVREALAWARDRFWEPSSSRQPGPGDWWSSIDAELDYQTGEKTTYGLHLNDSVTPSSWRRVHRLLCGK
jgi:hypothetical protein